ncbi:MAG: ribosomal protein S18-alanine N-acetyltransferase [Chloroflexi bacterium]|nr:ribosomal protein S18-alanine N-acetyltransferase [Chloroflexota bacterium]
MVERPPLRVRIEPMTLADLGQVHRIETASFSAPWPDEAYRSELTGNRLASYLVLRADDQVIGFGGIWMMVDEAHITTFAIDPAWRRQRLGETLLIALVDLAIGRQAREATLEVRLSNVPARRLYEKFGFRPVGVRAHYYSDNGEDALIMTTPPLNGPAMRTLLAERRADLATASIPVRPQDGTALPGSSIGAGS